MHKYFNADECYAAKNLFMINSKIVKSKLIRLGYLWLYSSLKQLVNYPSIRIYFATIEENLLQDHY